MDAFREPTLNFTQDEIYEYEINQSLLGQNENSISASLIEREPTVQETEHTNNETSVELEKPLNVEIQAVLWKQAKKLIKSITGQEIEIDNLVKKNEMLNVYVNELQNKINDTFTKISEKNTLNIIHEEQLKQDYEILLHTKAIIRHFDNFKSEAQLRFKSLKKFQEVELTENLNTQKNKLSKIKDAIEVSVRHILGNNFEFNIQDLDKYEKNILDKIDASNEEIAELESHIKKLSEEDVRLSDSLEDKEQRCTEMDITLDALNKELNELKSKMFEEEKQYAYDLNNLNFRKKMYAESLKIQEDEIDSLNSKLTSLETETNNLKEKLVNLKCVKNNTLTEINSEKEKLEAVNEEMKLFENEVNAQMTELERRLENQEQQHKNMIEEIDLLHKDQLLKKNDLCKVVDERTKMATEKLELQNNIVYKLTQLSFLQEENMAKTETLHIFKESKDLLLNKLKELEEKIIDEEAAQQVLVKSRETYDTEYKKKEEKLIELKNKLSHLKTTSLYIEGKKTNLNNKLSKAEQENKELIEELEGLKKVNDENSRELENLLQVFRNLKNGEKKLQSEKKKIEHSPKRGILKSPGQSSIPAAKKVKFEGHLSSTSGSTRGDGASEETLQDLEHMYASLFKEKSNIIKIHANRSFD